MRHHAHKCVAFGAFTLTELLVVIGIITILAGMLLPAIDRALEQGKQSDCISKLKNFGHYISMYQNDCKGERPLWLSQLLESEGLHKQYQCPTDGTEGKQGSRPDWFDSGLSQFAETNDLADGDYTAIDSADYDPGDRNTTAARRDIPGCSYMYEFTGEDCTWYSDTYDDTYISGHNIEGPPLTGSPTWRQVKEWEVKYDRKYMGLTDTGSGWIEDTSAQLMKVAYRVPVVRCYYHLTDPGNGVPEQVDMTVLNLRADGSVSYSPPYGWWLGDRAE